MNEAKEQTQTLEVLPPAGQSQAIAHQDRGPLSVQQVQAALKAIHDVMGKCMTEGTDYGKVPGCGDKPGLFQPGAQKLSLMFSLNPQVRSETITDYPNLHRGYRLVVCVTSGTKFAEGVGECSTLESKYRYRDASKTCPMCGKETIFRSKQKPGDWFCWAKKGGCGAEFAKGGEQASAIEKQEAGKIENPNPPDHWNTVRKMAFKRAFVHAIINATNTSELWSQDLEDLAENGVMGEPAPKPAQATPKPATRPAPTQTQVEASAASGDWRNVRIPFGKNKDKQLGELSDKSLLWYCDNFKVQTEYNGVPTKPEALAAQKAFKAALDAARAYHNSTALDGIQEPIPQQDEVPF